jgi:hypothetical protein
VTKRQSAIENKSLAIKRLEGVTLSQAQNMVKVFNR